MSTLTGMKAKSDPGAGAPRPAKPAAGGPRKQQKEETRRALLRAARVELKRHGFAKTTTRGVAEAAGVAVGTFFVHFRDLDTLVEALLDEHIAETLEAGYRSLGRKGDLVDRLVFISKKLYDSYDVDPALSRAYLTASLFPAESSAEPGPLSARLRSFREWVFGQIGDAVAAGEIVDLDREVAFNSFFSIYFGLLVAGLSGRMTRRKQIANLDAALRRLFLLEKKP